jgi:hypothetical protein
LNILLAFLLVLISVLLLAVCVFLARIDENIRSGGGANIQSLASPPPSPYSPPPPTVITPSSIASIEHKAVVWNDSNPNGLANFKTAAENEGVSTTDMEVCTTATTGTWSIGVSGPVKKCLMELLMSTLAKDNWALIMAHSHPWSTSAYDSAYYFTRTNYTTPTVAVSTVSASSASVSMEHKAVFWNTNSVSDFKTSAESEGVSTTDMEACSTSTNAWYNIPNLEKKCLVELLLSTLAKENWTLATTHAYNTYTNAYHFTRPVQTS